MKRCMAVAGLLLAFPQAAQAYVDPGTGAMLWQVAAATVIGFLFYIKRIAAWVRSHLGLRSDRITGFVFATLFALVSSPVAMTVFHSRPLPRFNDVFLVGIVLTAYLFTWESATYLLVIALGVSAWILPPEGSMRVEQFADWYRLVSFAVLSIFLICLITRMKARRAKSEQDRPFGMSRVAAGAD
jgi:hypothetical protein